MPPSRLGGRVEPKRGEGSLYRTSHRFDAKTMFAHAYPLVFVLSETVLVLDSFD